MTLDPLEKLIRAADGGDSLSPPGDLVERVRGRMARQRVRARTIRGIAAAAAIGLAALFGLRTIVVRDTVAPLDPAQIARLRSEADQLAAQAAALERQVQLTQKILARQELRAKYDELVALGRDEDPVQTAIDRAASIAVTEGDFSLQVRGNREDARAAYQRTIEYFPESLWAAVARERLEQVNMN